MESELASRPRVNKLIAQFSGIKKKETQKIVLQLSLLFTMDSFGGGFVMQSIIAYWLHRRYNTNEALVGTVLFVVNLVSAVSTLLVGPLAKRIGLVNTMVWTHLPRWDCACWCVRACMSNVDSRSNVLLVIAWLFFVGSSTELSACRF
jgi:Na+/melibiose symporter-like transporter